MQRRMKRSVRDRTESATDGKIVIESPALNPRTELKGSIIRGERSNGVRVSSTSVHGWRRCSQGCKWGRLVWSPMVARLKEGRKRRGREVMQTRYIGRASGSVGSKKEVVRKPRRRTDCKYLDQGVEARGENNGGYLRSGCGCRSGERGLTSKTTLRALDDSDHAKSPISDMARAGLAVPCLPWLRIAHGGSAGVWAATLQGSIAFAMRDHSKPSIRRRRQQQHDDKNQQLHRGFLLLPLRRNQMAIPAPRLHSGQMSQRTAGPGTAPLTQLGLAADSDHAPHGICPPVRVKSCMTKGPDAPWED